jgi:hypothetical protein
MKSDLFGGSFIGLNYTPPPLKADKGLYNGSCNRQACQKPGAVWINRVNRAYYCPKCANEINRWNPEGYDGHMLCELLEPPITPAK